MNSKSSIYKLTIRDFENENYVKYKRVFIHPSIKDCYRKIFRYIQIEHLLKMLDNKELYISNRKFFSDSSECGYRVNHKNIFPLSVCYRSKQKSKKEASHIYDKWRAACSVCVSCWTYDSPPINKGSENIDENYLMWKAYGNNNACCRIETTINDLIESINIDGIEKELEILISEVKYVDEHINRGAVQEYIFEKPIFYRDEREVRLCVLDNSDHICIKINPFTMIKKVIFSPFIGKNMSNFLIEEIRNRYPLLDTVLDNSHILES